MKKLAHSATGGFVGLTLVAALVAVAIAAFDWLDGKPWLTPDRLLRSENLVWLAFALLGLLFVALLFDR